MPKKPAVTIEIYDRRSGGFGIRFVAANNAKFGHNYDTKQAARKAVDRILSSIQNGDIECVDKTKRKRADDQCGE